MFITRVQWRSQDVFMAHKSSLFQYKNVVDYKVLDYFSAENTAEYN